MKRVILVLSTFLVLFGFSGTVFSSISDMRFVMTRCNDDLIGELDKHKAEERVRWFARCFPDVPRKFFDFNPELWINMLLYKNMDRKQGYKDIVSFPVIMTEDLSQTWIAPFDRNASCAIPGHLGNFIAHICQSGCYAPNTKLSFLDGDIPISNAKDSSRIKVLAENSTLDNLDFHHVKIERFLKDLLPTDHELLELTMKSGKILRVTKNHPILNESGEMVVAEELTEGSSLVQEDGFLDPIEKIQPFPFFGRVYNVYPDASSPLSNVVVANGYLNGSAKYQNDEIFQMNRMLFRRYLKSE